MKRVVNAVVRIEYEWDMNKTYMKEKDNAAFDLAITPNFCTKLGGVSLQSVHVEPIEPYKLIDWDKLEHNPEQVFINQ